MLIVMPQTRTYTGRDGWKTEIMVYKGKTQFMDGTLDGLFKFLDEVRDSIPEEFRAVAETDLEIGEFYTEFTVTYTRDATPAEIDTVLDLKGQDENTRRKREIAELQRLRKLYPDN